MQPRKLEAMLSCLIAEDEAITAWVLADAAEEAGYHVLGPYGRCSAVLQALDQVTLDVVILDVKLRDGPSYEIAEELCERAIPFVVYSGHRRTKDTHPAFDGAPWIDKPATPTEVLATLPPLIRRVRQLQDRSMESAVPLVRLADPPAL